jgi:hypothetical protein
MKTVFKSLCLFLCCSIASYAQSQDVALAQGEKMMQNHRAAFEENKGQVTGEDAQKVRYFYKEGSLSMFLLPTGIAYQFNQTHYPDGYKHLDKFAQPEEREKMEELAKNIRIETYRMDIELLGANPNPRISTDGKSQDYTQYYNHNALNVHNYSKITYHEVYPNIDWVIYKTDKALKYDFVVRAGGNPAQIQLKTNWVEDLQINADGGITLKNRMGSITEKAPISLQGSQKIATRFVQEGDVLSFDLGEYDRTQTLIIDPTLLWATYYGGDDWDLGYSCAVDANGNVYLAGRSNSANNIASGGHQDTLAANINLDAFLVKFNSAGVRQWGTYYGGTSDDFGRSCTTDAAGNVYLAGYTNSAANIASGGHQNTLGAGTDAFLVQFNSAGVRQWATYYGDNGNDIGFSCATDGSGNVYLAGYTGSTTNIASGGHQDTLGGSTDAFLVKFNSAGTRQWGTYYGGTSPDEGWSCATDGSGNVYLTGYTQSTTNIASGGHQDTLGGSLDAFLVKFNSAGTRQWATYYGDISGDRAFSCATDASGNVYLAGNTGSTTNIASGGHQDTIGGGRDAFLVKFNSAGTRQWATYYGGTSTEEALSCATDIYGNVYLAGETISTTNIASGGHQNTIGGTGANSDAFLVKFNSAGTRQWATYYGGTSTDRGWSCATDATGNVYFAGETRSTSNIASSGHQNSSGGLYDVFLAKFQTCLTQPTVTITQSGTTLQATAGYTSYVWSLNGTIISGATNSSHTAIANGTYVVTITDANGCQNTTTINYTASNINQISSADFVKIFPNPSEGIVNIHFAQDGEKVINIYDNLGRLVYQNQFDQLQNQISIQDLPNGVYQVQIIQSNAQMTKSLIIAK